MEKTYPYVTKLDIKYDYLEKLDVNHLVAECTDKWYTERRYAQTRGATENSGYDGGD